MKNVSLLLSFIFIFIAGISTPFSVGLGLYEWAVNDVELKIAAWNGFKCWASMLSGGLIFGLPLYFYGCSK